MFFCEANHDFKVVKGLKIAKRPVCQYYIRNKWRVAGGQ